MQQVSYSDERICRYTTEKWNNNFASQSVITSRLGIQCKKMGFTLQIRKCTSLVMMSNFLNHCNYSVASPNLERPNQNSSGGIFFCQNVLGHEKWRHDFNNFLCSQDKKSKCKEEGVCSFQHFLFQIYFVKFSLYISLRTKIVLILDFKIFVCSLTQLKIKKGHIAWRHQNRVLITEFFFLFHWRTFQIFNFMLPFSDF